MADSKVAVVDLSQDDEISSRQLYEACTTIGFFYVCNHGVPSEFVKDYFWHLKRIFALPIKKKMEILQDENNRGYTPMAEETLDPKNSKKGDSKEGFYFGIEVPKSSPESNRPLHGPNQWPNEESVPGFKKATLKYFSEMRKLGHKLLALIALSLGLPRDFFDDKFDHPIALLRPLHYSSEISCPTEGAFGAGAHTDYGMLTILANDDVPGLQIYLDNEWINVPPKPEMFIINLGDMLERWTNGMFKSTRHRVINTEGKERYSIPFFYEPNFDTVVECLEPCCKLHPPKYPPTTSGQHLLDKYAETHAGYKGPSMA